MSVRFLLHLRQWQKGSSAGEFTATSLRVEASEIHFADGNAKPGQGGGGTMDSEMEDLGARRGYVGYGRRGDGVRVGGVAEGVGGDVDVEKR